jgi:hypothetical protein
MLDILKDEFTKPKHSINNVPVLIPHSGDYMFEWKQKALSFLELEKNKLKFVQDKVSVQKDDHHKNLQKLIQDRSSQLKMTEKIIDELLSFEGAPTSHLGFSPTQSFYSYNDLVFRDWCWDSIDLKKYKSFISQHLDKESQYNCYLGAGACALPHEISLSHAGEHIAFELNPYLIGVASSILDGKNVKLFDFPITPDSTQNYSKKWEIKTQKKNENLHLCIGDFYQMPFETQCFDSIIACWFYDILDDSLEDLLMHTKSYLKDSGDLIFIAPNHFQRKDPSLFKTQEEIISCFESCGFKIEVQEVHELPYLQGEGHSSYRMEKVLLLKAKMIDNQSSLIEEKSFELDETQAIPILPEIQMKLNEHAIFTTFLKFVDGKNSIEDIAKLVSSELNISNEEALGHAKGFFTKLIWEIKVKSKA